MYPHKIDLGVHSPRFYRFRTRADSWSRSRRVIPSGFFALWFVAAGRLKGFNHATQMRGRIGLIVLCVSLACNKSPETVQRDASGRPLKVEKTSEQVAVPPESISFSRFERIDDSKAIGTSWLMSSSLVSLGDYLSRLWGAFGKPRVEYEGFGYALRDKETGLVFTVYSAGSGPAYGGFEKDKAKLLPLLKAFDEFLKTVKPVDCQIVYDTDFGHFRSGSRNGLPYDEPLR